MELPRFILLTVVAAALSCAAPDPTTLPPEVRAAADAIDSTQLRADVTYLASDALLGRDTPSPGQDSAAAYIIQRLTELKLKPAGDNGTFLQHYVAREIALDAAATFVETSGRRFAMGTDFRVISFVDSGTITGPMTYVGHGIGAPKRKLDAYAGVNVKGRILVAHGPGVFPRGESFQTLGVGGSDWETAQIVARDSGAAALILIVPPRFLARWNQPAYPGARAESRELWPAVPSAYARPAMPVIWIRPSLGAALLAGSSGGVTQAASIMAGVTRGDFIPSFEFPATSTATVRLALGKSALYKPSNVVAMIEGSDPRLKGEAVVIGAHLDGAVAGGEVAGASSGRDTIYNAADDNATGSASLLAMAAAMMRAPRPRRSVVFVWDTGEEVGLWGSRFFAAHPTVPLDKVMMYVNVDMIGRSKTPGTNVEGEEGLAGPDEIFVVGPRAMSTGLDSLLERTNREYLNITVSHTYDRVDHEFFYPRSDAGPFVERGVITVNWLNNEHGDYHGVGDEAAKLDLARMTRVTKTIFAGVWMVASVRARPVIDKTLPARVKRYK